MAGGGASEQRWKKDRLIREKTLLSGAEVKGKSPVVFKGWWKQRFFAEDLGFLHLRGS